MVRWTGGCSIEVMDMCVQCALCGILTDRRSGYLLLCGSINIRPGVMQSYSCSPQMSYGFSLHSNRMELFSSFRFKYFNTLGSV